MSSVSLILEVTGLKDYYQLSCLEYCVFSAMPSVPSSLNFQPTISKRSKALLQKKNRKASATGPLKAGTSGESDTDDVFFRLHKQQPLRGDSPSKQARADSVSASKRSAVPQVDWNVIAFYHAKHGFILQNFDLKVSSTS